MSEQVQAEPTSIPSGTEFTVYWCPRCKVQSSKLHHFCKKGPAMFPQMDEETLCIVTVLRAPCDTKGWDRWWTCGRCDGTNPAWTVKCGVCGAGRFSPRDCQPHSGMRIQVGEGDQEWEWAKDEELDHMTAEQLVYLYNAIKVTLQDRGAVHSDEIWWIP